jgi:hypothetical protein
MKSDDPMMDHQTSIIVRNFHRGSYMETGVIGPNCTRDHETNRRKWYLSVELSV